MAYEDVNTYNLDAYIARQTYIPNIIIFYHKNWNKKKKITVELSGRFVIDVRPVVPVLFDEGDDAGVDVECK
jgi:hypothetical protein